ncbi:MAG: hypothetical protein HXX13_11930 [Bacteroidetes bacterium]|nr:hypothetical protein [Bacteroidota bacterium]
MRKFALVASFSLMSVVLWAQNGLERILVERYYITDSIDSVYSHPPLPVGSVTYRIYADMLPGYKVQSIYGSPQHPLTMNTTTYFFNQSDYGSTIPTISANNTKKNTVMIDSWLTTGGACNGYCGVPKAEDNGVGTFVNNNNPQLLQNNAAQMGIPLTVQDGMLLSTVPGTITLGLDGIIDVFGDGSANGNTFYITNGAWSCLTGATGPIPASNKVLIAQITTNGVFHFELNIQIGTPSLGTENYVSSNPVTGELTIPSLTQTLYPVPYLPEIAITSPDNNASFLLGTQVPVEAQASDFDGTVSKVEFFADGVSIGVDTLAPYTAIYSAQSLGSHILIAQATDNDSQVTISGPVHISVIPPSSNVTFLVDMSRESISLNGIHIAGSFNNWNPSANAMTVGANNIYSVTVPLTRGQEYTYRFVNGNSNPGLEFVPAECGIPSGTGVYNRHIIVPVNDTTTDTVCFSMCSRCPVDIPVTFRVDMSNHTVSPNGVHLAGSFNNWNTSSTPMIPGANNIYSATVMLTPGTFHLYRFVNGNTISGYETVPSQCGSPSGNGGYDRYLLIPAEDTTLTAVCFGSCVQCGSTAQYVNVTFKVDMHHESVSANGVHIAGSFQGWQPGITSMLSTGDTVYYYTQSFQSGTSLQYKFVNGNSSNDYEIVPEACSVSGARTITVPAIDTTLSPICFASCDLCSGLSFVNVTFQVDMSLESVSPNGVHLAGSFQGWNPSTLLMTSNDSSYFITLQLLSGVTHEYRFVNGNAWNDAEIVPAECSRDGNRFFQTSSDTIIPLVCFMKCGRCDVGISDNPAGIIYSASPNPFSYAAILHYLLPVEGTLNVQVFNTLGQLEYETGFQKAIRGQNEIHIPGFRLSHGVCFCKISFQTSKETYFQTIKLLHL